MSSVDDSGSGTKNSVIIAAVGALGGCSLCLLLVVCYCLFDQRKGREKANRSCSSVQDEVLKTEFPDISVTAWNGALSARLVEPVDMENILQPKVPRAVVRPPTEEAEVASSPTQATSKKLNLNLSQMNPPSIYGTSRADAIDEIIDDDADSVEDFDDFVGASDTAQSLRTYRAGTQVRSPRRRLSANSTFR